MASPTVLTAAFAVLLLAADDPKKVPDTIQGDWTAVAATVNGVTEKAADGGRLVFSFTDKEIRINDNGREEKGTYRLNIAKKPITIDIATDKAKEILGIVEVDGDQLRLCFAPPGLGVGRPASFDAKDCVAITFKRDKK